jgi:hypothetical protein
MKKIKTSAILLFIVIEALFVQSGCDDDDNDHSPFPRGANIEFTMINRSDQEVHMWVSGAPGEKETIGPGNKLEPNTERIILTHFYFQDEADIHSITIAVGQNGQIITSAVMHFDWDYYHKGGCRYIAVYQGSETLLFHNKRNWGSDD